MREKLGSVQGRSWLRSKFKANLEYMRPCLKRSGLEGRESINFLRVPPTPTPRRIPHQSPLGTLVGGFKETPLAGLGHPKLHLGVRGPRPGPASRRTAQDAGRGAGGEVRPEKGRVARAAA
ncbi:hypothetical protein NN561_015148 [Cricetulus griseus]